MGDDASGLQYDVRWVPGYRPVESRLSQPDRVEAFATVDTNRDHERRHARSGGGRKSTGRRSGVLAP